MTHTYATLAVPAFVLEEVRKRLLAAYSFDVRQADRYFDKDREHGDMILLPGVALVVEPPTTVQGTRNVQDHHRLYASELWANGSVTKLPGLVLDYVHTFGTEFAASLTREGETAIMYAPSPLEAIAKCFCELHVRALMKMAQAGQDGFLGMTKDGTLVDRRDDPGASHVASNSLLNIAAPKRMWVVSWDWKDDPPATAIARLLKDNEGYDSFSFNTNSDQNAVIVAPKDSTEDQRARYYDHWCEHGDEP